MKPLVFMLNILGNKGIFQIVVRLPTLSSMRQFEIPGNNLDDLFIFIR